jgi:hypothetical protein
MVTKLRISHMVTKIWAVVVADIATELFLLGESPDQAVRNAFPFS